MQRHSVTSFETDRSLANGSIVAWGWGGIPRELQRLLSLIGYGSTGGVCGRSLTAGENSLHWQANMLPLFSIMTLCLWSIRERWSCLPFPSHIALSINNYLFPFHLEKNLNLKRYNFLIDILDVCRIPRIHLNAKIDFITSLRLLFYSESMRESYPYIKYSMNLIHILCIFKCRIQVS